jgi:SAM-dependent methyltransferase
MVDLLNTPEVVDLAKNLLVFVENAEMEIGAFAEAVCSKRSASSDRNYSALSRSLLRAPGESTLRRLLSAAERAQFNELPLAALRDGRLQAHEALKALTHRMSPEIVQNFIRSWNMSSLPAVSAFFDMLLGVEGPIGISDIPWHRLRQHQNEQRQYEPTYYEVLRYVSTLLPILTPLRLVDVGSGYGRAALYLALSRPNLKVHGIELIGTRVAHANQAAGRFPDVDVTFTRGSAADERVLPDADVYYFFNPVTKETMEKIIVLLQKKRESGHVFEIVSYGISHEYFEARRDLFDLIVFTDLRGMRVSTYRSRSLAE